MIRRWLTICLFLVVSGCENGKLSCKDTSIIVAPEQISNEVSDIDTPTMPKYTPWWKKEEL